MRITTRLRIISTMTIAALIIMVPILIWSFIEFKRAENNYIFADTIRVNFFERTSIMDQYFLYREERVRAQWGTNMETSDSLLRQAALQFHSDEDRQTLERLQKHIEDTAGIFHRIVNNTNTMNIATGNRHVYEELDKRLYSQLLLKANSVRDAVTLLKDASAQHVELTYKQLTLIVSLFAITLALATIMVSRQLARLIRKRLIPLHDGARIISEGNLGHRIKCDGADEFTELGQAINGMTEKLAAEINERKQAEIEVRNSEEKLRSILSAAEVAVAWANEEGEIEYANPKFISLFGYTLDDVPTVEQWYLHAYPDASYRATAVNEWNAKVALSLPAKTAITPMEVDVVCKDGSMRHVLLMGSWAGSRLLANFSDITERKRMEEQIRQLAFYDPLTKLPNRRLLSDRLGQAMSSNKRRKYYGALIFLDLDNFKPLNDAHGHTVGDLLLIETATRLKNCVRAMDTVARFGGDEFIVMLSELDTDKAESYSQAGIVAEKIRTALSEPYRLTLVHEGKAEPTVEHHCTASIGVVVFFNHEGSQNDILEWADDAMYQAKESGRNSIRFHNFKD
ncbi:MAG: diguanylate cyclase [Gallionellaceae bacterium]|jgi:diguanylate cyclase (GGDEF)-like protein/PAS domain S-box-containing protein